MGLRVEQTRRLTDKVVQHGLAYLSGLYGRLRLTRYDTHFDEMVLKVSLGLVEAQKVALRVAVKAERAEAWFRPTWYDRLE